MDGIYLIAVMVVTGGLITAPNNSSKTSTVNLGVEVHNSAQVDTLMNKLRRVENVFSVTRPMKIASD